MDYCQAKYPYCNKNTQQRRTTAIDWGGNTTLQRGIYIQIYLSISIYLYIFVCIYTNKNAYILFSVANNSVPREQKKPTKRKREKR